MVADVPRMTWFVNVKVLLWRFVDKMDGLGQRAAACEKAGIPLTCP
jgi:hypothetical protein